MNAHFSSPKDNVLHLGLREGMKVADLGAGSGHYARAAAPIVGHGGRVYAIDVQEDVLKHIKSNTHERHQGIIEHVWGNIEKSGGTHLRDATLDAAILANTLFQLEHRDAFMMELKRVLKSGAKLLVIDWAGSYGGIGPRPDAVVSEHDAEAFFINNGFHKVKAFRAGSHHYGIIFTAP
jgi:ubiquinone/menaquinone biosynthesis C-methylase UbiE